MTNYPTVKDLVAMDGNRRRDPKPMVVLDFDQAILLHNVIMSSPPAGDGFDIPVIEQNKALQVLWECGFVRKTFNGKWTVTGEGVAHMTPTRRGAKMRRKLDDMGLQ